MSEPPVEITPEIRQAVYVQDCERLGHVYSMDNVMGSNRQPMAQDPDRMPYINCIRCQKVWLVVEAPEINYDAAETVLLDTLKSDSEMHQSIRDRRDRRKTRKTTPPLTSSAHNHNYGHNATHSHDADADISDWDCGCL